MRSPKTLPRAPTLLGTPDSSRQNGLNDDCDVRTWEALRCPTGLLWDKNKRPLYITNDVDIWQSFLFVTYFSKNPVNITADKPEAHP